MASCRGLFHFIEAMAAALVAAILFAATPTPAPVRITRGDVIGMWVTVDGDCRGGQHLFNENGKYKKWCFDSVSEGEWFLGSGNKIILRHDPKTADAEIIAIVSFGLSSDHRFLNVRYSDGRREQWMK
jgi:hypothetical protein